MANIGYALDILGTNPDNKVSETRTLTKKAIDGRAFVIPKAAPFFAQSVSVSSGGKLLVEDKDYHLILVSEELSHATERKVVGGILFNTLAVNTSVTFEVQTVGGNFSLPIGSTVENLSQLIRNPLFTTWSQLVGTPEGLPTYSHVHDWGATVGYEAFVAKFEQLINVLMLTGGEGSTGDQSAFLTALQNHIMSKEAHDKSAVGLGNLSNFSLAQDKDYTTTPYPNNKYVTPRSVMYAIDLFIGNKLTEQTKTINELTQLVSNNTQEYRNLVNQWNDLNLTLVGIDRNYQSMVSTVNNYAEGLQRLELEYRAINDQQKAWASTVSDFNKTITQFTKDYNAIVATKAELLQGFAELTEAYNSFKTKVTTIEANITANSNAIAGLQTHSLYPVSKVLPAGSFNFKIKPKQKFHITLIGAGGGCGDYVTDSPSMGAVYNGEHGGSTTLHCLQDLTNGEYIPSAQPLALAGGGFGGMASYGSAAGVVTIAGIGGRGGTFKLPANIVPLEASNGEGGFKGSGNYVKGQLSTQDTGYEIYGQKWGRGSITEVAVGQGGEGAIVRFEFENKLNVDLEFMVCVGAAGRSYSPEKSNAIGGLAIINLVK